MRSSASRLTSLTCAAALVTAIAPTALAQDQAALPDSADTDYTVRIGFPSGNREATASSPADIWAQHLGIFDDVFGPVDVTLQYEPFLGAGPAINEALIAGSLDVANYADTAGVLGRTAGADTSLVAIDDPFSAAWLVVPEASDVQSVEDLRDHKVATIKATFPHRFLLAVLAANGLAATDIEFINLSLPDSEVALEGDTKRIVWEYRDDPPHAFFSAHISGAQRLPNGNTLITEGAYGRIIEVTAQGETVWEYVSPYFGSWSPVDSSLVGRGFQNPVFRSFRHTPDEFSGRL